ncbi:gliding motility protein GldM [Flavobacterium sp. RHBU_24]|uniref:type IX secretion system motor protein PorM/GldM n=1 Tax=Flavobacterium sp. RHBU_24 TaxID=3391185 RepID=UPI003984719B
MAGGKQTPRQKMVNLMYLVFIAMMALNMSKEVLSAFGLMNEQFESSNIEANKTNGQMYDALAAKAAESPSFKPALAISEKVKGVSAGFFTYIEGLKRDITKEIEKENGKLPYEQMDKGDKIDEAWFAGDGYSAKGNEVVATIEKYKNDMKAAIGNDVKYKPIIAELEAKFSTADVTDREGVKKKYLDYHYKGFPAIASLTKLSAMQNNVEVLEASVYNTALGKAAIEQSSMKHYTAMVMLDKNAYFEGEKVTGRVVLGRYDENTQPTSFDGPGKIENGQAKLDFSAAGVGEHEIKGKFVFTEDGQPVPLAFSGKYVVVPQPKEATISAEKMNVVYRGVDNPIAISVAGIGADKVKATAPGLKPAGGPGKFVLNPGAGSEVTINVNAEMPGGRAFTAKKAFRIKGLPAPTGKIRGEVAASGPKSNLEVCTITAALEDFDFPVNVTVTEFTIKVPGQSSVVVQGSTMNSSAKAAIAKASKGDVVTIMNIKAKFEGINQLPKRVSTATYEIK